jgi:hypothetical protein
VSGTVSYSNAYRQALFVPSGDLSPRTRYTARVLTDTLDLYGNPLAEPYAWTFVTGAQAAAHDLRIVGRYVDRAEDLSGSGAADRLTLDVDVEVRQTGYYCLNGRLLDQNRTLLGWATTRRTRLQAGVHTLSLPFEGAPIRVNGVDGPYVLDALHLYDTDDEIRADRAFDAYRTYAYAADRFQALLEKAYLPVVIRGP